jgi:ribonucleoside-diphosphate reductase alpha chain
MREKVKGGMRNANVMAVAPNASIAYQLGCEQSHEPFFSALFTYENKSGNYYIVNKHLVRDLKADGLWSPALAEAIKAVDGDVLQLDLPQKYKDLYKKCFDRDMYKLIDACAARQKWVDQGLSFNLYNGGTSLKYLNDIYMHCWKRGLKSTYYLRNKPASKVSAVTSVDPKAQELAEYNRMMDEAKRKAESGEACESCQG